VPRKLKFSLLLPIVQVIITAVLTLWADRVDWMLLGLSNRAPGPYVHVHLMAVEARHIWSGINAPTFPFCFATGVPLPALGMGVGEILYLVAVSLQWYLVGSYFDQRRGLAVPGISCAKTSRTTFRLLLVGWGTLLLLWNVSTIGNAFPVLFLGGRLFRPDVVIVRTLFLLWSAILVVFPALKLAQDLRQKWAS
jgi:hypothetical protein